MGIGRSTETESALVVLFPTVDPLVVRQRSRLDSGAVRGVGAHVTVLYPFLPPSLLSSSVRRDLRALFERFAPFRTTFDRVGWFEEGQVHLVPSPDHPFRQLTAAVADRWPDWPPYGGVHGEPTPHLTIGDLGTPDEHRRAAEEIGRSLPLDARVSSVHLLAGSHEPGSWGEWDEFALGR